MGVSPCCPLKSMKSLGGVDSTGCAGGGAGGTCACGSAEYGGGGRGGGGGVACGSVCVERVTCVCDIATLATWLLPYFAPCVVGRTL